MASKICRHDGHDYVLNYTLLNPSADISVLILHGWGSNQRIMQQALGKPLGRYRQVYVDMPGFGKSPNDRPLTTEDYAAILHDFLTRIGEEPSAVIGHSFGGKVATLLNPPLLVLLASAGIPVPKPLSIRFKIFLFKILKPLGVSRLRAWFVSSDAREMNPGMYQTFKNVVNEDFSSHFSAYTGRAICFWGKEDTATPFWTGAAIDQLLPNSRLVPMEGDHFFFLKQGDAIAAAIDAEFAALSVTKKTDA